MAPKRKQADANNSTVAATRVTRSSTRRANSTVAPPAADPQPPKKKKVKATTKKEVTKNRSPPSPTENDTMAQPKVLDGSKTIIIEHCKQCNSFKTRAIQVMEGLEKNVVGVNVMVNPDKPRRGCFEIRDERGEVFVSLLDMKRPFQPLKALDMEKVISDITEKIQ